MPRFSKREKTHQSPFGFRSGRFSTPKFGDSCDRAFFAENCAGVALILCFVI